MASLVSYYTILNFYKPHKVYDTHLALIIALLSAITSFIFAFFKLKLSKKFGLLSLKADSVNSIKDSLGSIIAILGLTLTEFNFVIFDLISALIISGLVFYVSITVLKESSLILLDACQNPELHEKIRSLIIKVPHIRDIREIKLRKIGIGILAEIVIEIDGEIEVKQLKEILKILEEMIKINIKGITKVNLLIKY